MLLLGAAPAERACWAEAVRDRFPGRPVRGADTLGQLAESELTAAAGLIVSIELAGPSPGRFLEHVHAHRPGLAVVFVAGPEHLETALAAIEHGASDYVLTAGDYCRALPVIVERALNRQRTARETRELHARLNRTLHTVRQKNRELEQAVSQLRSAAGTDPLTGLANRRAFGQALSQRFAEAKRHGRDLACLMLDLDQFKQLNDARGHPVGDRVLEKLGRVLEACCRQSDAAGRFGGDEFIVLLPETDTATAAQVADRIRAHFEEAMQAEPAHFGSDGRLTMSQGLASVHEAGAATAEQLVACADHALYQAKHAGGNQRHTYRPSLSNATPRQSLKQQGTAVKVPSRLQLKRLRDQR